MFSLKNEYIESVFSASDIYGLKKFNKNQEQKVKGEGDSPA